VELIEHPERVATWLAIVADRLCLDRLRRHARGRSLPGIWFEPDEIPTPDEVLVRLEQQHHIREAMAKLDRRCRKLLHLLFYEQDEQDYDDVARRMGIARGSVGPTRSRCFAKLLRHLNRGDREG